MKKSLLLISLTLGAAGWAGCNCCKKPTSADKMDSGTATPGQSGQSGSDDKDGKYQNPPPPHEAPKPGTPDKIEKPPKKGG